ncbi:hypothetical protein HAPG_00080 [Halorubrum phage GNf2]|uniref:hypothetical protein n=1 Tax=Halorubrum sp. GN12_10-3_MGM TaxID=2518113 RepID=UPI0002B78DCB|nr:hypothetical protein [Halorubrum sp. GN12_10-3_MGM]AGF91266.1 hypothetical protein HAPG_00080 [Halorubrum phage GNf2]TKX64742.1 hypothetical protein EXE47_10295 [Halorubrum sp. GN12_10-3_MGM]
MLASPLGGGVDAVISLATGNGVEVGMLATALLVIWRGHRVLAILQSALETIRIGFIAAAAVGLLVLVAIGAGWISVSSLPVVPSVPLPL